MAMATPTLTTPALGAATATTINGITLTTSAGGVLTLVAGKTLTVNKSITLEGTDSTVMTFPSTSATIARIDAANTFVGASTASAWVLTAPSISNAVQSGITRRTFAVPTAKTVSATLTGAEVIVGMITVNQGAAAASALQLPTGAALDAAISPALAVGDTFDVSVMNLSTVDTEDASITTNVNMTLVGSMDFQAHSALASGSSSGILRVRKTAANTFTVYRIA